MGNRKSREASRKEEEAPVESVTPIKAAITPHNFQAIIKNAALQPSMAAPEEHMHYPGIFLNNKTKKYWVDKETGINCFALFARGLSITWSDDPRYWEWISIKETGDVEVQAASLRSVCWLEIHGKLDISFLTPKAKYEVAFDVMLEEDLELGGPVNLRLRFLPAGGVLEAREESLQEKPRGRWISLRVCELTTQQEQVGEIEVSLFSYTGVWKHGLVVRSVTFRPSK